ncbi:MAG: transcription-repair coupling factor [Acidimicrobiales bacterium]|nr:transcription-repair coupling factor [Acidimicrobiales bacterium]
MAANLHALAPLLRDEPGLLGALGRTASVLAVPEPARAIAIAGLAHLSSRRPILVAVPATADAERLANDLAAYLGHDDVEFFPAWETLPFERLSPGIETMGRRLRVLWRLRQPERAPRVVVAPIRALIQRLGPHPGEVEPIVVRPGDEFDPTELVERLVSIGYRREYQVEHRGTVAVRGSIIDVFPSTADAPVRIDLWGDEVDRLTEFTVAEQRSINGIKSVEIFPCRELLPTAEVRERAEQLIALEPWGREHWERIAHGLTFDGMESWLPWLTRHDQVVFDLLDEHAQILLVEPRRLRDRAGDIRDEEADLAATLARTWGIGTRSYAHAERVALADSEGAGGEEPSAADSFPRLHVRFERLLARTTAPAWSLTVAPEGPNVATVAAAGWVPVAGDARGLLRQLRQLLADGFRVIIGADGPASAGRLANVLADEGLTFAVDETGSADLTVPGGVITVAPLERGFILPSVKLAVLVEADLTGRRRTHRKVKPRRQGLPGVFEDLEPGAYVVHHQHGVARYGGMVKRSIDGVERDYLLLEYRGGDKLYVPSDQIDAVRHYTGGDSPSLSRLGGSDWHKTKAKVRAAVSEIAQELVVLYQKRIHTPGHAFSADSPWQHEFESSFPYEETPDQLKAIEDVKADMEAPFPMDRLVCGDVGFGKTEVAVRAAFKAVQDGKQVAVLVPTTLLARQHHETFSDRFSGYPIRVEMLSRLLTQAQAKKVIDGVASGEVDVVIGTHRLLSDDVTFKALGLLVVDEEQRFGVAHKEKIKQLRTDVDVLTLTATPIPRTLEMSLTGIRDLSIINTPPADRQPILTYVGEYDERAVAEAIRRELLREGQVFYVHNRVHDIEHVAATVRELVPEARVAVAHGQMDEGQLEQTVIDFWEARYDVLVCTTIIESGIDMPTVNTLVVDRADLLGLGQLHQLRGRVGRSGQRAYAYLFFPPDRALTEEAYDRLKTIAESTELGSGFKIAMRDLEIRGAGNLLGNAQAGHIAAVGYDLYCQMVNEAVAELKGEPVREPAEIKIELPLDANIPKDYIAREEQRLEAYRRLAAVTTGADVEDIRLEWVDRYGPVPAPAEALLAVARLRAECVRTGVREVVVTRGAGGAAGFGGPKWVARLCPLELKTSKQMRLTRLYKGAVYKTELRQVQLPFPSVQDCAGVIVEALRALVPPDEE